MASVTVKYNGSPIKSQTSSGAFKLSTSGKVMSDDVTIETDTSVTALTATYDGNTILETSGQHIHKLSCKNKVMSSDVVINCEVYQEPLYIAFSSQSPFSLSTANNIKTWNGTIEYSADKLQWTEWDGAEELSSYNNKLYLRGTSNTVVTGQNNGGWILTGSDISCDGNLENVLDYVMVSNGEHPTVGRWCFAEIFKGCSSLVKAPDLPYKTSYNCYRSAFEGCTSLVQAPELPSVGIYQQCFLWMFKDCTSLAVAPKIPNVDLTSGCTSCYGGMFENCISLIEPPALPATVLADGCYSDMFKGCTSLVKIPELVATAVKLYSYRDMFNGCTKIKISDSQTSEYNIPFRMPSTGDGTSSYQSFDNMFSSTGGTFTGTPTINTKYYTSNAIVPATQT